MNLTPQKIVLGALLLIVLAILIVFIVAFFSDDEPARSSISTDIRLNEIGSAGEYGYAVFSFSGSGNATLIALNRPPKSAVYVINDPQAIGATKLPDLMMRLKALESYGFSVTLTNESKITNGIYIIPSGAMPGRILPYLQSNVTNTTFIYLGATDLLLTSGVKRQNWYSALSPAEKNRLVVYPGNLDALLESKNFSLVQDILYDKWHATKETTVTFSESGKRTIVVPKQNTTYLRLIYELPNRHGFFDGGLLPDSGQSLVPIPSEVFPAEHSTLMFTLNKTNGTAMLNVKRNGIPLQQVQLLRVTDENVFIQKMDQTEPGDYVVEVNDNSGRIASGLLHVKDLRINYMGRRGVSYLFKVTQDGKPLESADATVSLSNSTNRKRFFVNDGILSIDAKLNSGLNTFNIVISGKRIPVPVQNNSEPILEFYLKYGIPAVALIVIVYLVIRLSRSPKYGLRFGDGIPYVREEVRITTKDAMDAFVRIRKDMQLTSSPITLLEFGIALKRYATKGADITDGNVEAVLKSLVEFGKLENHREYYQFRGEGNVERNALKRMIREKLIENGIDFEAKGDRFVTKDCSIGFFGDRFQGKAIIVVDDESEGRRLLNSLPENEKAKLKIKMENGLLTFAPIDNLSDIL